jgi:hypothetical protein
VTDAPIQFCPRCGTALPLGGLVALYGGTGLDDAYGVCNRCGAVLEVGADQRVRVLSTGDIQVLPEAVRAGLLGAMEAVVGRRRPIRENGDG